MGTENREISLSVAELREHLQRNLEIIDRKLEAGLLKTDVAKTLREHLTAELDYLSDLPPDISLGELMEEYSSIVEKRNAEIKL